MADEIKYVKTQLNERTANGYNILYPQTIAEQVITNDNAKFVTAADITKWNEMSAKGLFYAGVYDSASGLEYPKNAIVLFEEKYYFCIVEKTTAQPNVKWGEGQLSDGNWQLLSYEAAYADEAANALKLGGKVEADLEVAKAAEAANALKLNNKEEKDLEVAKAAQADNAAKLNNKEESALEVAKAAVAVKYVSKEYVDADKNINIVGGQEVEIADQFNKLEADLAGVLGGGTHTANKLTVTKDGANGVEFDGSSAVTVDIKQTYGYADIVGLMKEGVIDPALLPASILGQLEYQGSWSVAVGGYTPAKGHYFIASAETSVNPDGSAAAATYHVGDWAVYNGTSWDKIDNTDAVTMVNGRIGAVETYQGDYANGQTYHKGDIVKNGDKFYICLADTAASAWDSAAWGMLGATYSSVENNPVVIEGFEVKHAEIAATTVNAEEETVGHNGSLTVPVIERDGFGHITKITNQSYKFDASGADSWRSVQIEGTEILDSTPNAGKPLNLSGDKNYINVENVNGLVTWSHKTNTGVITTDLTVDAVEGLQAGQSFKVPSIEIDGAGHVISAELKEIKLGDASIAHELFEIKSVNNVQTIGAYKGIDDISKLEGKLKFYQGAAAPTGTDALKLNGAFVAAELYQGANKVVDSSAKVYGGIKQDGSALEGSWNAESNRFELGDSGVHDSTEDPRVYSAVSVNQKGIVVAGGQIVEFGKAGQAAPSESLAVGGLFFRHMGEVAQA